MQSNTEITEVEAGQIDVLLLEGKSLNHIANIINQSRHLISNYIKRGFRPPARRSGRPRLNSPRLLWRDLSNQTVPAHQVADELNLIGSKSTNPKEVCILKI